MGKEEIGLPSGGTYLCSVLFSIIPKVVVIVSHRMHDCYVKNLVN